MSATLRDDLEIKELLSRIDKQREEALKLAAEQHKLTAEAAKLERDRGLAPWLAVVAILASLAGMLGGIITVLHIAGGV